MSEGGHTPEEQLPEKQPQTPTERSKHFVENSKAKMRKMVLEGVGAGALGMISIHAFSRGDLFYTVSSGLMAGVLAYLSDRERIALGKSMERLSVENARLKQDRQ